MGLHFILNSLERCLDKEEKANIKGALSLSLYCQKLLFFIIYSVTISLQLRDPSFNSPNGFQLGILQGSSTETYFKNHIDDDLRQLYDTNLKFNLMNNFTAGIQALEKGYARGLG